VAFGRILAFSRIFLVRSSAHQPRRLHDSQSCHNGKINPNGPASKLIVICNWTQISLIFREDCTIFCEGEWLPTTTKITWRLKQAAALGVATLRSSAIENEALTYYFTASSLHMHSLVSEKMWWWLALARKKMWLWIASFGESYNGDVLQLATVLLV